jgi:hypothetical protein
MSRRLVVLLVTVSLAAFVLALPQGALARRAWYVSNKSGHRVGYIVPAQVPAGGGPIGGKVFDLSGKQSGWVAPPTEEYFKGWAVLSPALHTVRGWIVKGGAARFDILKAQNGPVCGRCSRDGSGRWIIQRLVGGHYVGVGTVSRACPGAYAAGAGKLRLW